MVCIVMFSYKHILKYVLIDLVCNSLLNGSMQTPIDIGISAWTLSSY